MSRSTHKRDQKRRFLALARKLDWWNVGWEVRHYRDRMAQRWANQISRAARAANQRNPQ